MVVVAVVESLEQNRDLKIVDSGMVMRRVVMVMIKMVVVEMIRNESEMDWFDPYCCCCWCCLMIRHCFCVGQVVVLDSHCWLTLSKNHMHFQMFFKLETNEKRLSVRRGCCCSLL